MKKTQTRRGLPAVLCGLFLTAQALAVVYSPSMAPKTFTEPEKVAWAFDQAAKGNGHEIDLRRGWRVSGLHWKSPDKPYWSVVIHGVPFWNSLYGEEPFSFEFKNLKHSTLRDVSMNGGRLTIVTDGSSSGNVIDHLRMQRHQKDESGAPGLWVLGLGGADVSNTSVQNCEFQGYPVGLKVSGPNALDIRTQAVFNECGIGADFSDGGCNSVMQLGFSNCGVGLKANAGYQLTALVTSCELTGTAVSIGGDGAGGHASKGSFRLAFMEVRDTPLLLSSFTGGLVEVDALRVTGSGIKAKTEAPGAQELVLKGAARTLPVSIVGPVKVTGQVQVQ